MAQNLFPSPSWNFKKTICGFESQPNSCVNQFFGAPLPVSNPKTKVSVLENTRVKNERKGFKNHRKNGNFHNFNSNGRKGAYHCDTCDKPFNTRQAFDVHVSQHETCGREGCTFTAHPKVVAKHVAMQHRSGLFKRLAKAYSQEEVDKWIDERKRCYPSRKRIEEKKQEAEVKQARGERLKEDKNRFNDSLSRERRGGRGGRGARGGRGGRGKSGCQRRFNSRRRRHQEDLRKGTEQRMEGENAENVSEDEEAETRSCLPRFAGTGDSRGAVETTTDNNRIFNMNGDVVADRTKENGVTERTNEATTFSDDEWVAPEPVKVTSAGEVTVNKSLLLLQCCYGSDSDENDEAVSHTKQTPTATPLDVPVNKKDSIPQVSENDEPPLEVKTKRSREEDSVSQQNEPQVHRSKRSRSKVKVIDRKVEPARNKTVYRRRTLLEDLLKKEIRHERNLILQCVHYVVEKNFWDK